MEPITNNSTYTACYSGNSDGVTDGETSPAIYTPVSYAVSNSSAYENIGVNTTASFSPVETPAVAKNSPGNTEVHNFLPPPADPIGISLALSTDGKQLNINWTNDASHSEGYDVEWTFIDKKSAAGIAINASASWINSRMADIMKNNSTRISTTVNSYSINLPYEDGYVLVRIRGVYLSADNVRLTTNWSYQENGTTGAFLYKEITNFQPGLNWQYTGSFAEEGKSKEVISFFDGSLRSRQTVTYNKDGSRGINDNGKRAIIAETIYDNMGRPAVNILPVPANIEETSLNYHPGFNKNSSGLPYSYSDINNTTCYITAGPLLNTSGASQYYSPSNDYLSKVNSGDVRLANDITSKYKYIPDAANYPYTLTEYMPDNTGRIRRQSGVGTTFKMGNDRETKYFYGKPLQRDLDRMFGVEVGNASHYLKNMVMDANKQISLSYIDANGKTVATALAGAVPANLDALASAGTGAVTKLQQNLLKSEDFTRDATSLSMQGTATFLATVSGGFELKYAVSPVAFLNANKTGPVAFCTNCYYRMDIKIRNGCGDLLTILTGVSSSIFKGDEIEACSNSTIENTITFNVQEPGEYTVTYTLELDKDVIKRQEDFYIEKNIDLKQLQQFFEEELPKITLDDCYRECSTCAEKLGTKAEFTTKMNALLAAQAGEKFPSPKFTLLTNTTAITNWISATYDALKAACTAAQAGCSNIISPCEQKLQMLKKDVLPGGQYALYTYNVATDVYAMGESTINVMRFYNKQLAPDLFPDISYVDDNGATLYIKNLTVSEFIRAYIKHPEWADKFVEKHIEYCSYKWCIDESYGTITKNNEVSYKFDEGINNLNKGADAVAKLYYKRDYTNIYTDAGYTDQLLKQDPFFNGGRGGSGSGTYYTGMQNDLNNLSTILKFNIRDDVTDDVLPKKNILEFIDWMLYRKPAAYSSTATADLVNSWKDATTIPASCRSVSREWDLYRMYYLQVKSKYFQLVKQAQNPECKNCFIGTDGTPSSIGACIADNPVDGLGRCPTANDFETFETEVQYSIIQSSGPYIYYQTTSYAKIFLKTKNGLPLARNMKVYVDRYSQNWFDTGYPTYYRDKSLPCIIDYDGTTPDNPVPEIIFPAGATKVEIGSRYYYNEYSTPSHYINHYINVDVSVGYGNIDVFKNIECVSSTTASPASSCQSESYADYKYKTRIFNEYVNMDAALGCNAGVNTGGVTADDGAAAKIAIDTKAETSLQELRNFTLTDLEAAATNWSTRLKAVRDEESNFTTITNTTIDNIVVNLKDVATVYINAATTADEIRIVSTLPAGLSTG